MEKTNKVTGITTTTDKEGRKKIYDCDGYLIIQTEPTTKHN